MSPSLNTYCQVIFVRQSIVEIEKMLNHLWDADFQTGTISHSSEDRTAYERLTSSVTVTNDGHYQLSLL